MNEEKPPGHPGQPLAETPPQTTAENPAQHPTANPFEEGVVPQQPDPLPSVAVPVQTPSSIQETLEQIERQRTERFAIALEHCLEIKKLLVAAVRWLGWRSAMFCGLGVAITWALAYFGQLPVMKTPRTHAEVALGKYSIERIDSRDDKQASPPTEFIADARRSVLITGFSAFRTVENNPDTIQSLLDSGVEIYMLVLDPRSTDVEKEQSLDPKSPVKKNQRTAIETVVNKYWHKPNFHLRFMKMMPPITGILVDAEVEPRTARPSSNLGRLRYQVKGYKIPQRRGYVFQLKQSEKEDNPMFNLFWADFRDQWKDAQDPKVILKEIGIAIPPSEQQSQNP